MISSETCLLTLVKSGNSAPAKIIPPAKNRAAVNKPVCLPPPRDRLGAVVRFTDLIAQFLTATGCFCGLGAIGLNAAGYGATSVTAVAARVLLPARHSRHLYRNSSISDPSCPRGSLSTWTSAFSGLIRAAFFATITVDVSRPSILYVFGAGASTTARVSARHSLPSSVASRRLGGQKRMPRAGESGRLAATKIGVRLRERGYKVAHELGARSKGQVGSGTYRTVANCIDANRRCVARKHVDDVFLVRDDPPGQAINSIARGMKGILASARPLLRAFGKFSSTPMLDVGITTAVSSRKRSLSDYRRGVKRALDIFGSLAGLVIFAPLLLVIAVAIRLDSPGPVIFRQRRAGFRGRIFKIYKFRTMAVMDDGDVVKQASRGDPRVTRVGRFLRRTSLDELPQLLNVLEGEMSLVGPRPHALAHEDQYQKLISTYTLRNRMKPGISGWAQIKGFRGETAMLAMMERRVQHDLYYIDHWSVGFDLWILALTTLRVVWPRNAY